MDVTVSAQYTQSSNIMTAIEFYAADFISSEFQRTLNPTLPSPLAPGC